MIALLIYAIGAAFAGMFKKGNKRPPILRQPYERRPVDARPYPAPAPAEPAGKTADNTASRMLGGTMGDTVDVTGRGGLLDQEYGGEETEGTTLEGDFSTDWPEDPSDPEGVSLEGPDAFEPGKGLPGREPARPFEVREVGAASMGDVPGEWKEEELAWDQAIRDDGAREISWDDEVTPPARPASDMPARAATQQTQQVSGETQRPGQRAAETAAGKQDKGLWPASTQDIVRGFVYAEILRPPLAIRRGRRSGWTSPV